MLSTGKDAGRFLPAASVLQGGAGSCVCQMSRPCAAHTLCQQQRDGSFLLHTFILSLKKMSFLPFILLLFYSRAPLIYL